MRRLAVVFVFALFAACTSANAVHLIPPDQLPPDLYGPHPQAAGSRVQNALVYFVRGNQLVPVFRSGPSSMTSAQLAMRQLLTGPSPEDQADGLTTAIPSDTALLGVVIDNGVATVNLSQEFERAPESGSQVVYELRLAQVVYTLTELTDVDAVRFKYEGDPVAVIDQDGNPVNGAVSRARYSRFQPTTERVTPVDPCSLVESLGSCSPGAQ
jgi:hypothetical protein